MKDPKMINKNGIEWVNREVEGESALNSKTRLRRNVSVARTSRHVVQVKSNGGSSARILIFILCLSVLLMCLKKSVTSGESRLA